MYLFLVHSYLASKIKKMERPEEKVTMGLKRSFKLLMDCEIVKKQPCSLKNAEKLLNVRREEPPILRIYKEFYLKNPKSTKNLKKYVKNGASKTRESVRKVSKTCKSVRKVSKT